MYFEEFRLHDKIAIRPVRIEKEEMLAFAQKYDRLPVHMDEEYAKTTRFGQVIAPGIMTFMSVWASFLEEGVFGNEMIAGMNTKIDWFRPVFAEDVLHGEAEVTNLKVRNERNGMVELTISAYNQHNELVLTDVTEVVFKRKSAE